MQIWLCHSPAGACKSSWRKSPNLWPHCALKPMAWHSHYLVIPGKNDASSLTSPLDSPPSHTSPEHCALLQSVPQEPALSHTSVRPTPPPPRSLPCLSQPRVRVSHRSLFYCHQSPHIPGCLSRGLSWGTGKTLFLGLPGVFQHLAVFE